MPFVNPAAQAFNQFNYPGASAYGNYINAFGSLAGNAISANAGLQAAHLNAAVDQEGNRIRGYSDQQRNLFDRLSAYERNYLDHDLGLKGDATNRYNIDTGRQNILSQLASQDKNYALGDATNRHGIDQNYQSNVFGSLASLAGNRHGADRAAQATLGSAALNAQSNMLAPQLQQQRFTTMAPHILGAISSLGRGQSALSNSLMNRK